MPLKNQLYKKAKLNKHRIIFPEGEDYRIMATASKLALEKIATPVVITEEKFCRINFPDLSFEGIEFISPREHPEVESLAQLYASRRSGVNEKMAMRLMKRPLYLAGMLLSKGDVDAMVAGATKSTGQVVSAACLTVGLAEGITQPSSFFIMLLQGPPERLFIFADCALTVEPTPKELADIALLTARNAKKLLDLEPRVGLLSFSTHGSAKHGRVDKMRKTFELIQAHKPDFPVDGELQVDSALSPEIAKKKCPYSPIKGDANILIFPDLDSGNIGYKLVQYFGGVQAIGPVLQGLQKPVNDLSRGASIDDIMLLTTVSSIQASKI